MFRIRALAIEAKERDPELLCNGRWSSTCPCQVASVAPSCSPRHAGGQAQEPCRASRCSVPSGPSLGRLPHYVCHLCDSWRRAARTASASWSADSLWLVERLANHQSPRRPLLHTERRPRRLEKQVSKSRTVLVTVANSKRIMKSLSRGCLRKHRDCDQTIRYPRGVETVCRL